MRPSLENIEFIENYILGNFDPSEHELAKQRIDGSSELSQLLETQQCLYSATRRKALRSEIQSYAPAAGPSFFQQYRNWFIGGLAVLGIIACFAIFGSNNSLKKKQNAQSFHTIASKNEKDIVPWIPFDVQYFDLIAEKGGTLLGKDGTLIILGGNSLLDIDGNLVSGKVEAELIEAIDWEDMLAYNLTTTSDGKALSSGGMMRIRYKQNGKEIFVNPEKPMHVEIPTDECDPKMKVWEGEVKGDQLDWKNPQDFDRYLTQIDLKYLEFIPTGFDAEVAAILPYNGHEAISNRLVDSLYYSIAANRELFSMDRESKSSFVNDCYFDIPVREDRQQNHHPINQSKPLLKGTNSVTGQIVDPEGNPIAGMKVQVRMDRYLEHEEDIVTDKDGYFTFSKFYPGDVDIYASLHSDDNAEILWKYCLEGSFNCPKRPKNFTLKEPLVAAYSNKVNFDQLSTMPSSNGSFIDPLKIKTLRTSRFQNTFIATKEFEQRLQVMHQLNNGSLLLDTYIRNLSEPMWKCDEMAARLISGSNKEIFEDFAAQRLTNVQNDGIHQEALMAYYSEQRKAYRTENRRRLKENQTKSKGELMALSRSIETSLEEAAELASAQAAWKGRNITSSVNVKSSSRVSTQTVRTDSYAFSWSSNSWCNIDQYILTLGANPWLTSIQTNLPGKDITVYKTVRALQTIIGLSEVGGSYQAMSSKTNTDEDVCCLAMYRDEDQLFLGGNSFNPKNTRNLDLNLVPVTEDEFYLNLCLLAPSESLIAKRLRAENAMLIAQAKVNIENAPYMRALESAKNDISSEVVVYNRLFDYLNGIGNDLVQ